MRRRLSLHLRMAFRYTGAAYATTRAGLGLKGFPQGSNTSVRPAPTQAGNPPGTSYYIHALEVRQRRRSLVDASFPDVGPPSRFWLDPDSRRWVQDDGGGSPPTCLARSCLATPVGFAVSSVPRSPTSFSIAQLSILPAPASVRTGRCHLRSKDSRGASGQLRSAV